ncbi:MAG: UbiA family prenyltransferase, partial [Bacteroidota bacterium]
VYDFRIDRINRPNKTVVNAVLSVKKVLTFYFICTFGILVFSVGYMGFYLHRYNICFINILSAFLLFLYASRLKRIGVAGNLTIAFLIALVLILAYYLYDDLTLSLFWATIFAFEITLIREITKDVEDIRGDLEYRLRTLPIQVGVRSTKRILGVLYVVFMVSVYMPFFIPFPNEPQEINWPYLLISLILVQLPAIYLIIKLQGATKPLEFGKMSRYLKYLMLGGMLTLFWL